ncbi:MAG: methyltransferase [Candidatus Dormibacteria bacterium]
MSNTGPAADLWTLSDLCTPWCIRVAATLRIAEHIDAGITDIGALAVAASCTADSLHSVLSYLVAKGIFLEEPLGQFALNEAARGLLSPGSFLSLDGIGGRMTHAWSTLLDYVRTGEPGYRSIFGLPFWDDLSAHPDLAAEFDTLMSSAGHGTPDATLEITGGWERVRTVVDVGGGTGAMLAELLRRRPHLHGVLVDLPGPVARAAENFEAAGVAGRVTTAAQSFFDPIPAGADVYVVRKVLNDWPDRDTVAILRRCAEAARPAGIVVVLGGVVPDGTPRPIGIEMVLLGGKTNSLSEFSELAREAGLDVVTAEDRPPYFVVECRPTAPR